MANFKALKKIAALVTAIALVVCFAVSASAVDVLTTTTYVTGSNDELVDVNVVVTGLANEDAFVTYYATQSSTPVHIDQVAAENNAAEFNFRTEATKLESSVVIGRTSADAAITGEKIDGLAITWKINGGTASVPVTVATEVDSYTIAYTPSSAKKEFDYATVNGTTVAATEADGNIVVPLDLADGVREVEIVIYEKDIPLGTPSVIATAITAAAVEVVDGAYDIYDDEGNAIEPDAGDEALESVAGNRKLTVIGNAAGAEAFGIIISDEEFTVDKADSLEGFDAYEAISGTAAGTFAVQIIDASADHDLITDAGVYVAVYAFDGELYSITAFDDVVTVE